MSSVYCSLIISVTGGWVMIFMLIVDEPRPCTLLSQDLSRDFLLFSTSEVEILSRDLEKERGGSSENLSLYSI